MSVGALAEEGGGILQRIVPVAAEYEGEWAESVRRALVRFAGACVNAAEAAAERGERAEAQKCLLAAEEWTADHKQPVRQLWGPGTGDNQRCVVRSHCWLCLATFEAGTSDTPEALQRGRVRLLKALSYPPPAAELQPPLDTLVDSPNIIASRSGIALAWVQLRLGQAAQVLPHCSQALRRLERMQDKAGGLMITATRLINGGAHLVTAQSRCDKKAMEKAAEQFNFALQAAKEATFEQEWESATVKPPAPKQHSSPGRRGSSVQLDVSTVKGVREAINFLMNDATHRVKTLDGSPMREGYRGSVGGGLPRELEAVLAAVVPRAVAWRSREGAEPAQRVLESSVELIRRVGKETPEIEIPHLDKELVSPGAAASPSLAHRTSDLRYGRGASTAPSRGGSFNREDSQLGLGGSPGVVNTSITSTGSANISSPPPVARKGSLLGSRGSFKRGTQTKHHDTFARRPISKSPQHQDRPVPVVAAARGSVKQVRRRSPPPAPVQPTSSAARSASAVSGDQQLRRKTTGVRRKGSATAERSISAGFDPVAAPPMQRKSSGLRSRSSNLDPPGPMRTMSGTNLESSLDKLVPTDLTELAPDQPPPEQPLKKGARRRSTSIGQSPRRGKTRASPVPERNGGRPAAPPKDEYGQLDVEVVGTPKRSSVASRAMGSPARPVQSSPRGHAARPVTPVGYGSPRGIAKDTSLPPSSPGRGVSPRPGGTPRRSAYPAPADELSSSGPDEERMEYEESSEAEAGEEVLEEALPSGAVRSPRQPDGHKIVYVAHGSGMAFFALAGVLSKMCGWHSITFGKTSLTPEHLADDVHVLLADKSRAEKLTHAYQRAQMRSRRNTASAGGLARMPSMEQAAALLTKRAHSRLVINYFAGSRELTLKTKMLRCLRDWAREPYQITPPTFIVLPLEPGGRLKSRDERLDFEKHWQDYRRCHHPLAPGNTWIAKSSHGSKGDGMKISARKDVILEYIDRQEPLPWVVQLYIEDPFLIKGRKFDIRAWVLVLPKGEVYFSRQGVCRTSSYKYEEAKRDLDNIFVHLTNHHIQEQAPAYQEHEAGNELFFDAFHEYLQTLPQPKSFYDDVLPDLHRLTAATIAAGRKHLVDTDLEPLAPYQLFGFDFLLDGALRSWLLEVNGSPAIAEVLKDDMSADLAELVFGYHSIHPEAVATFRAARGARPNCFERVPLSVANVYADAAVSRSARTGGQRSTRR
eukprot:Hpha_TRINITY_DN16084_c1_g4::TRINITY_DN16084_c1_g4_i1::g.120584::m.120584